MAGRVTSYIGLGANLGDAPRTLAAAANALRAMPDARLASVSRLYVTRPVGVVEQPDFHNAAVRLEVPTGPDPETGALALLSALKQLEGAFGRRMGERWGPRELDLDLLLFGAHRIHVARPEGARSEDATRAGVQWLDVPHASARERLFVLAPLADLSPDLVPPGWEESIRSACLRGVEREGARAIRAIAHWDLQRAGWSPARGVGTAES
ncbi:MAG: 2-amino-4-hydroxy-6-hydroxymethyldihydropteridine diphosphokinase [Chloroflexi bacterium]|nr:2-amino-4-hydroxy-6-hydroxymethyldihydropteridine diphosphokinase [Chloroflexota bacterium]